MMEKDTGLPSCCGTLLQVQPEQQEQKRERDPRAGQGTRGCDFCRRGVNQPLILALHCGLLRSSSTDPIRGGLEQTQVVRQAGELQGDSPTRSIRSLTISFLCFRVFSFLQGEFL